jgi:adenosylhomocysteine nucleosidase
LRRGANGDGFVRVVKSDGSTLVCFALKEEAVAFEKLAADRADVHALVTGIGRANAESNVSSFLTSCRPRFALTCGFAGGLDPQLAIGDVVFATDDDRLRNKLSRTGARPAKFFCSSRIAVTRAEKTGLRRATGADAVEMESEAIQSLCRERGIPCATVRAISDTANEDLPLDFNQLAKPDLSVHYGKLALAIAKSPGKIPDLRRLQKNCRLAAERLAAALIKVIELL